MAENANNYPDYFPDGCPPSDAEYEEMLVYRLCKDENIAEDDFLPHVILFPKIYDKKINAYGLSVYSSVNEIKKLYNKLPAPKKFKCCVKGITYKHTGVIKKTSGPYHYTWWLYRDIKPHLYFQLCTEEIGGNND